MARKKGLFRKIVCISLVVIIAMLILVQNSTFMEWIEEYYPVIALTITIIFLMGFFMRWKHKDG